MRKIFFVCIALVACFLLSFPVGVANATVESMTVYAVGEYDLGGNDTREQAKNIAFENAKRHALEQVAVNIESKSSTSNGKLTSDTIMSYARGRLKIVGNPKYTFLNDGMICRAQITAVVEVDYDDLSRELRRAETMPATPTQAASKQPTPAGNSGAYGNNNKGNVAILDGAIQYNGHYYKQFNFRFDWNQAKEFCESVGGYLATIENEGEANTLHKILKHHRSYNVWVGGYKDEKNIWRWVTGGMILNSHWAKSYPSSKESKNKMMVSTRGTNSEFFFWFNSEGKDSNFFICEWDSVANAHESNM